MAARDRERALDRAHLGALLRQAVVSAKDQEMTRQEFINAATDEWMQVSSQILEADLKTQGDPV